MAKPSAATDHALGVVAYLAMAADLSNNVQGMEGFRDFFEKELPAKDRAIIHRFEVLCKVARIDLLNAFEQEAAKANG